MKKTITVFGSAMPNEGEEEYNAAYKLGCLLGRKGFDINTGGYGGIMEAVSKGVMENSGNARGITLRYVKRKANKYVNEEIVCDNLFDRIAKLIELGDAFIILPGGTGTLLELAAVWEFLNKGLMDLKPAACYSLMWKQIGEIVNRQLEKEMRATNLVSFFDDIDLLAEFISTGLNNKQKSNYL
jgi:uncharacterized protein (TIGR00730 family)